jgi:hypothetical protein
MSAAIATPGLGSPRLRLAQTLSGKVGDGTALRPLPRHEEITMSRPNGHGDKDRDAIVQ